MNTTQKALAEFIGTLALIFIGTASICADQLTDGGVGLVGIALAHGLTLAVMVTAVGHISGGHINPAVTAGLYIARKVDGKTAASYVAAQLLGALLGALLVQALLPAGAVQATSAGTPALANSITFWDGVWIEAVLTFFLVSAVFGTAVSAEAPKVGGFGIGLAVFVDALVGGPLTGAAMNPARAFGPAVVTGELHGQAVYWIGPLIGALVAGVIWKLILLPRDLARI